MSSPDPRDICHFVNLYCRYRLKRANLRWFEAPYCSYDDLAYDWSTIELAAIIFEEKHAKMLEALTDELCKAEFHGFWQFRRVMQINFGQLEIPYAIIAGLAFTGRWCQRLQSMDIWTNGDSTRDFGREIWSLTLHASFWARRRFADIQNNFKLLEKAAKAVSFSNWMIPTKKKEAIIFKFRFTAYSLAFALICAIIAYMTFYFH